MANLRHARARSGPIAHALRQRVQHAPGFQQPAPAAPAPAQAGPAVPPVEPYDTSTDALLQRVRAAGENSVAQAQAAAISARRQAALDYGDEAQARALGLSEEDIQAAKNNPFSTSAKMAKAEHDQPIQLSSNLSQQNLGYSSAGATQQSDLARALLENRANAARDFQSQLSGIQGAVTEAQNNANEANMNEEEAAAGRLQQRLGDLPVGPQGGGHGHGGVQGAHPNALAGRLRQRYRPRQARAPIPHLGNHP